MRTATISVLIVDDDLMVASVHTGFARRTPGFTVADVAYTDSRPYAPQPSASRTTAATASGGREGRVKSSDGNLDLVLSRPVELNGPGAGTNPSNCSPPDTPRQARSTSHVGR